LTKTIGCIAGCMCVLLLGCAQRRTMIRAEPVQRPGQDVIYKNGMPIIISKLEGSELVIQPMAGATGRYSMQSRVGFVAAIHNLSARRIEVSEASFAAVASGETMHVLRAAEIEDEIQASAAWAQTFNAVAGAMAMAGTSSPTLRYAVARDIATTSRAIDVSAQIQTGRLASALQRTTLEAGESVIGGISVEAPRDTACSPDPLIKEAPPVNQYSPSNAGRRPGVCRWTLYVNVGSERHIVQFNETVGL
jgi:hypothetical protein